MRLTKNITIAGIAVGTLAGGTPPPTVCVPETNARRPAKTRRSGLVSHPSLAGGAQNQTGQASIFQAISQKRYSHRLEVSKIS